MPLPSLPIVIFQVLISIHNHYCCVSYISRCLQLLIPKEDITYMKCFGEIRLQSDTKWLIKHTKKISRLLNGQTKPVFDLQRCVRSDYDWLAGALRLHVYWRHCFFSALFCFNGRLQQFQTKKQICIYTGCFNNEITPKTLNQESKRTKSFCRYLTGEFHDWNITQEVLELKWSQ